LFHNVGDCFDIIVNNFVDNEYISCYVMCQANRNCSGGSCLTKQSEETVPYTSLYLADRSLWPYQAAGIAACAPRAGRLGRRLFSNRRFPAICPAALVIPG
ncbi:MAG TPA: hypothetical protein VFU22_02465, partial [Roseiflexaceae bacterium]|nr:hypothetical protein [Roseiflexaceae bacterium]